ncbi:hypothetical protein STAS_27704 [Striga asiatica]|uniref:MADS-box domain-containing protein n=1 Tax=Striga asiatica TaxID=4170 RepID=A0A5A7QZ93_STRAF|nr:hypothetical protein STAS_27704 [Striga asiatica]
MIKCISTVYCRLLDEDSLMGSWLDNPPEGNEEASGTFEICGLLRDSGKMNSVQDMLHSHRSLISKLAQVDPGRLNHDERLAFWINVHNALVMHAAYSIGGHTISVDTIQSSILGCRLPRPTSVRTYTPKKVSQELEMAKEYYIRMNVKLHKERRLRVVPKKVEHFVKEIGGLSQSSIDQIVMHSMHDSIDVRLSGKFWKKVDWIPYDFAFRILLSNELVSYTYRIMGRAKLNMEFITKEKTRNTTFAKRKKGLIRKLDELTILCDVSACIIIYGPKNETGLSEPDVWPTNPDQAHRIIQSYRAKNNESSSSSKTYGLHDFWLDRLKKVEDELAKQRKKNMEARYPTWLDFMDYMPETGLRDFAAALARKAEDVRSRIECMRGAKQGLIDLGCYYTGPTNQFQQFGFGQGNGLGFGLGIGLGIGLVQYPKVEGKVFEDNGLSFYGPGQVGPVSLPALPAQPAESNGFGQEGFDGWCQMNYGRGSYYE